MSIRGIAASKTAAAAPADATAVHPVRALPERAEEQADARQPVVPRQSVPSTAEALPVAETALRRVLAAQGNGGVEDATATALDLLRSVEALLRAAAPEGTSPEELGAAAARLVERQGLLARLSQSSAGPQPTPDLWRGEPNEGGPSEVDTRL